MHHQKHTHTLTTQQNMNDCSSSRTNKKKNLTTLQIPYGGYQMSAEQKGKRVGGRSLTIWWHVLFLTGFRDTWLDLKRGEEGAWCGCWWKIADRKWFNVTTVVISPPMRCKVSFIDRWGTFNERIRLQKWMWLLWRYKMIFYWNIFLNFCHAEHCLCECRGGLPLTCKR